MFVAIVNKDTSAIVLDGMIKKVREANEITPGFAMDILSKTNHRSNIKTLVKAIKDKCANKEDILPYREFILSCVDAREVSGETLVCLQDMADLCGCDKEFEEANGKPKFYGKFDCNNTVIVKSEKELKALKGENLKVLFDAEYVVLRSCILDYVKDLRFKNDAYISFGFVKGLPENLDFSQCNEVNFYRVEFDRVKNLRFKEGSIVNFERVDNFPKIMDLSMCSDVCFSCCNLSKVKKIRFKDEEQKNKFMKGVNDFKGKVVYAEVENIRMPVNGGVEM